MNAHTMASAFKTPVSHRESDTNYRDIIAQLNDRWRVIRCKDSIQYILQQSRTSRGEVTWTSRSFVRTKAALLDHVLHRPSINVEGLSPDAVAILNEVRDL